MLHLWCRNKVEDFEAWRAVFAAHAEAHRGAGLVLAGFWRGLEDPNDVFFIFEVESLERAKAFLRAPEAVDAGRASGVLEGEYRFLTAARGYLDAPFSMRA